MFLFRFIISNASPCAKQKTTLPCNDANILNVKDVGLLHNQKKDTLQMWLRSQPLRLFRIILVGLVKLHKFFKSKDILPSVSDREHDTKTGVKEMSHLWLYRQRLGWEGGIQAGSREQGDKGNMHVRPSNQVAQNFVNVLALSIRPDLQKLHSQKLSRAVMRSQSSPEK